MAGIAADALFPEVGQAVWVRNRLATVRAVEPYDTRGKQGRLHIVDVEYLDDCRFPEAEQVLWEVEATAKILAPHLFQVLTHITQIIRRRCSPL